MRRKQMISPQPWGESSLASYPSAFQHGGSVPMLSLSRLLHISFLLWLLATDLPLSVLSWLSQRLPGQLRSLCWPHLSLHSRMWLITTTPHVTLRQMASSVLSVLVKRKRITQSVRIHSRATRKLKQSWREIHTLPTLSIKLSKEENTWN